MKAFFHHQESRPNSSIKGKGNNFLNSLDLPVGVLASAYEFPRTYESEQAIPESISGFQPDMDPRLRQALEALDDDAFVDDELADSFFDEVVADGERGSDEDLNLNSLSKALDTLEYLKKIIRSEKI